MKAIVMEQYGHADVLNYTEIDEPELKPNDILIEIKATSVNPVDWQIREGYLQQAIPYEFPLIIGWDAAGVVKKIGSDVSKFSVGDEVYSSPDMMRNGTYAEYVAVDENMVAKKPRNLTFEEAASIPLVGLTAWTCLVDVAKMTAGERVFIQGGPGGVGSFAIQLAKAYGCWVATTGSGKNVDFLKQLGADQVINYEEENFEDVLSPVDIVLDTLGGDVQNRSFKVLKKGGRLTSTTTAPDEQLANDYEVNAYQVSMGRDGKTLAKIAELLESEKIKPVVEHVMNLSDVKEGHRMSATGHARGKIVLKVH
ncbi:NADP-dependent oxidoreductase [Lentibacillus cibarius]|uniref:NADP-dependent oxidoreductase n=1 Tax=Lentibacillus cibarius TaxID=2583219 RepID=A0A5S3QKE5_9BACI|nr:NADP-dependent oxidoreductase [Lentibacillus cibarius]TMN21671.1 NADP-dependent oxidoreductase [Lentibacillus cibarius]